MKKLIFIFLLVLATATLSKIEAKGIVVYHNGTTSNIVEKLPEECVIEGKHVNLAVMYDQFGLFWLPVWNYGTPQYILLDDDQKKYWETDDEILEQLKTEYNISFPSEPAPSLWNKIGLKPVIILILLFAIWSIFSTEKDEEVNYRDNQQTT